MLGGNVCGMDQPGWVFVSPVDESLAIRRSPREDDRVMSHSVWITFHGDHHRRPPWTARSAKPGREPEINGDRLNCR
jgi:hypothetical protein